MLTEGNRLLSQWQDFTATAEEATGGSTWLHGFPKSQDPQGNGESSKEGEFQRRRLILELTTFTASSKKSADLQNPCAVRELQCASTLERPGAGTILKSGPRTRIIKILEFLAQVAWTIERSRCRSTHRHKNAPEQNFNRRLYVYLNNCDPGSMVNSSSRDFTKLLSLPLRQSKVKMSKILTFHYL